MRHAKRFPQLETSLGRKQHRRHRSQQRPAQCCHSPNIYWIIISRSPSDPTAGNLQFFSSKLRKVAAQLPYLPRALALVWASARGWTTAWAILLLAQGLLPVATVYLTRLVVDSLVVAMRSSGDWNSVRPAILYVAAMAAVLLLSEVLRSLIQWIRTAQAGLVRDHISSLIHQKSVAVDLAFYESPDYYDHLHRARSEAGQRPIALVETLGSLLQNSITLAAMLAVLAPFGLWLPAALLLSTVPALWIVLRYALRQHQWRMRVTSDERRSWYYDWLLTSGETAAELRLFGLADHFQSAFQSLRRRLRGEQLELARGQSLAELAAGAFALLITAGALVWMIWNTVRGRASLGDLALFYQAFQQGLRLMRNLLENVGQLYYNSLFLGNLFEFLSLETRVAEPASPAPPPAPLTRGIAFQHVTFRYPDSRRIALQDFNLVIPPGQFVAIVGSNGAGKSTLIKLLCRFYDPEAGRIELDGTDLRQFNTRDLRRMITVLFQQPVHYNDTASHNIALGDLPAAPPLAAIRAAAESAGAATSIEGLPKGYDNMLGRWFQEGAELSVGEWQKIALARAFLRQAPIMVLDEPTSAMDPWAEAEWLDRFRALAAGRIAVIITHRFTTAMRADMIHVMAAGRIVESGRHQDLLARDGLYARGWAAQVRS
jgi:ATP-binding cassette subfamily B protein